MSNPFVSPPGGQPPIPHDRNQWEAPPQPPSDILGAEGAAEPDAPQTPAGWGAPPTADPSVHVVTDNDRYRKYEPSKHAVDGSETLTITERHTAGPSWDEQERWLTAGLVGVHGELYQRSAGFHQTIAMLVRMLPLWVDALAAESVKSDAYMAQAIDDLRRLGPPRMDVSELRDLLKPPS